MAVQSPDTKLGTQFSSPGATPTPWEDAVAELEKAEIYWASTVRTDGRPHVAPLIGIFMDGAMYFCTGEDEQKAKNLAANQHCAITIGCNKFGEGLDIVLEGDVVRVRAEARLQRLADARVAKYGEEWRFEVRDGAFVGDAGNKAIVYEVAPAIAFGFARGESFSQTRWRF